MNDKITQIDTVERVTRVMATALDIPHERVLELFNSAQRKNNWDFYETMIDLLAWWFVEMEQKEETPDVL